MTTLETQSETKAPPKPYRPAWPARPVYPINRLVMRWGYGLKVLSPFPEIAKTGSLLLLANHVGSCDPLLLQAACPRPLRFMAAREYISWWPGKQFAQWAGTIPVDRHGKDAGALRECMAALAEGDALGIFPEGMIASEDKVVSRELMPFLPGAALMARRAKAVDGAVVPILLAGIEGRHRSQHMLQPWLWPLPLAVFRKSVVAFAETTITVPKGLGLEESAAHLRDELTKLRKLHGLQN